MVSDDVTGRGAEKKARFGCEVKKRSWRGEGEDFEEFKWMRERLKREVRK